MELFTPIFNQMIFLFAFIAIGLVLSKCKFLPDNAASSSNEKENKPSNETGDWTGFIKMQEETKWIICLKCGEIKQ